MLLWTKDLVLDIEDENSTHKVSHDPKKQKSSSDEEKGPSRKEGN